MSAISIIGSGIVGSRIGAGFEQLGHDVIFYDIDRGKIQRLMHEHTATDDLTYALNNTEISFVCVPTPFNNGFDNRYIVSVIKEMANILKDKDAYHLIVIKSTVAPTTTEKIVIPLLTHVTQLGSSVGLCMNPEFLTEITSSWTEEERYTRDFFTEERIVIGEYDIKSGNLLENLYKPLNKPIFRVNLTTAEIIKYASNCMLATKISFWNEMFLICQDTQINSHTVAEIVGLDPRIGKYGTIHGKAFGGKCLPKDLKAFIEFAETIRDIPLLKAVDTINEEMLQRYGVRE
jgi:UDPglucose 6-dehydrogenase